MEEKIRHAVQARESDYETLGRLLACYEAWGGQAPQEICAGLDGRLKREIDR